MVNGQWRSLLHLKVFIQFALKSVIFMIGTALSVHKQKQYVCVVYIFVEFTTAGEI